MVLKYWCDDVHLCHSVKWRTKIPLFAKSWILLIHLHRYSRSIINALSSCRRMQLAPTLPFFYIFSFRCLEFEKKKCKKVQLKKWNFGIGTLYFFKKPGWFFKIISKNFTRGVNVRPNQWIICQHNFFLSAASWSNEKLLNVEVFGSFL